MISFIYWLLKNNRNECIEKQIEKAEEERNKNEKLYKTLGTVIGLAIVIILI